nr:hypothetical protein [Tanacetum cinerariifolium]
MDEDDAARHEGVITLFEQEMAAKEDLRKQYSECKDISPERRSVIEKFLDNEAWKDYEDINMKPNEMREEIIRPLFHSASL